MHNMQNVLVSHIVHAQHVHINALVSVHNMYTQGIYNKVYMHILCAHRSAGISGQPGRWKPTTAAGCPPTYRCPSPFTPPSSWPHNLPAYITTYASHVPENNRGHPPFLPHKAARCDVPERMPPRRGQPPTASAPWPAVAQAAAGLHGLQRLFTDCSPAVVAARSLGLAAFQSSGLAKVRRHNEQTPLQGRPPRHALSSATERTRPPS